MANINLDNERKKRIYSIQSHQKNRSNEKRNLSEERIKVIDVFKEVFYIL
jgi:hypothetical protein